MSKVAGFIIGAALIAVGIFTGNVGLIIQGSAMIITQAIVDLTMPKTPARQASEMSIQLGEQPRSMLVGETFTAGSLVDGFNYGGKYGTDWECLVIRLADHKVEGLTGFYVNDEYVVYTGNGNYPQFDSHHFELFFRSDTSTQPLPDVVLDHAPGWNADDIGESGADVVVCYLFDPPDAKHPAWPGGRPRFGFIVKGKQMYDPRKDDTVPGGSGAHRWDDPATWEWTENAAVCRYNWVRGVYADDDVSDPTKLLVGRGLTAEEAPPENIIAAANLCGEAIDVGYPYAQAGPSAATAGTLARSANGLWMIAYNGLAPIEWWDLAQRRFLYSITGLGTFSGTTSNIDVADDGTIYYMGGYIVGVGVASAIYTAAPGVAVTKTDVPGGPFFTGITRVFDPPSSPRVILTGMPSYAVGGGTGYCDSGTYVTDAQSARDFCLHGDGSVWGLFQPAGSSAAMTLRRIDGAGTPIAFTGLVTRTGADIATFCHVPAHAHFFVLADGKFYCIADDTAITPGTIKASGALVVATINLPRKEPGRATFWSGASEYSLETGAQLQTIDPSLWLSETFANDILFDPNGATALINNPGGTDHLTWRFLYQPVRYSVAGPIYANQEYLEVEEMFAAATAGSVITTEGSVELEPGHAKSVVASFTDADLLSGSQVSWNQGFLSESNAEWVNTIVARYVEPNQQWNDHAAPVVRNTDDIIADGRPREASITLRLVRYVNQALRAAEVNRRLGRLWGRANVKLGPRFCELEDGDWISWQSDRYFNGGTRTFRIEAYSIDDKWQNSLTLREINASVYSVDAVDFPTDQSTATPTPPPPDIGAPDAADWDLAAATLDSAGASVPALVITGAMPAGENAEAIIVEYWKSDGILNPLADPDAIPWVSAGRYPASTTRIELTSLVGGATYYVALSYVVSGILGDRLALGPATVAELDVSGQIPDPTDPGFGGVLPIVDGSVPPVFIQNSDGTLIYTRLF